MPDPEILGLLSLLCLQDSRRDARRQEPERRFLLRRLEEVSPPC